MVAWGKFSQIYPNEALITSIPTTYLVLQKNLFIIQIYFPENLAVNLNNESRRRKPKKVFDETKNDSQEAKIAIHDFCF